MEFDTKLIHGGISEDKATGAVSVPIYMASTFHQQKIGENQYEYSRSGNPTREAVEKLIAELEGGTAGFAFASGSAAIYTVFSMFSAGDHFVIGNDVYGGTFRLIDAVLKRFGMTFTVVDTRDLTAVEEAITPNTKAIYLETPTNPLLRVTDIAAVAKIAKLHQILSIIDNTFSSPYVQRPLEQGVDIVLHSASKYLGGHSDVIAGLVVTKDDQLAEKIGYLQNAIGGILAPQESWLLQRGIKTLSLRMRAHLANAEAVFNYLSNQPLVSKIYYPGDPNNPDYEVAKKQMHGFGAMISFELQDGLDPKQFVEQLHVITLAESLGALESLIEIPALMTHGSIPRDIRLKNGIKDELIRLSVGVEDQKDLLADLESGFNELKRSEKNISDSKVHSQA
ncbi:aminotransferase class V-fold PLP-dependent enzyme [Streptococcus thermophilus]|uniref:trans-sulfuration enzyme family protein n=1 Tax=Streptococcus thermophilus TaxID=1308 RepID=UPI001A97FF20|nr:aminotransferase class I/II-fold pyridoxal phosphate-dependent enzyme [Streptococcus thermophilus]MBO1147057.1 aminotransferase class V-fold PLP-dependent enzyme [Streptococcus thermophilus]MBO1150076.1 aminotransferase class V-fold PLP-dependent enzyme [Streptococcus thermophilus]MBO1151694.1 aminotransferase class V-fold PLP-dependent enzyme [Streptococcus thermophilus]MBO1153306.1 aminotransferase class V-fold PLP-dependent enzyme [Streptococcus thermophilus]MBO1154872.1 aminotransferase